jgi:hypothetical protein
MNDLLTFVVKAHGGLGRWNQLSFVKANVSITGAIWAVKCQPDVLNRWHDGAYRTPGLRIQRKETKNTRASARGNRHPPYRLQLNRYRQ